MKSFACLSVVLIAIVSGVSFSDEPLLSVKHEVTISSSSGGSVIEPGEGSFQYVKGASVSIEANPDAGYEVESWDLDGTEDQVGGTTYTLSDIQADHSVYVSFKKLEYAITASTGPNGSISPSGTTTVTYDSDLAFTATPNTGYQVDTWSVDDSPVQTGGTSYTLSDIQAAHTVEVTFRLLEYVVTGAAGPNGSISPSGATTVTHGSDLTFTATPNTGYRVDSWSVDGSPSLTESTSYTLTDIQADHTVRVTFRQVSCTVTATAGPNGSVSPSSVTVSSGGNQTFTATPNIGYEVDTWFLDGTVAQQGGRTYTISPIKEDRTLHVTFRQASAYSLGDIDFEDEEEFENSTITNNEIDEDQPDKSRIHIERVVGVGPESDNAVMGMYNLEDLDPTSSTYGKIIHARVKGAFIRTGADEVLIRFKYLFATPGLGIELVVYLSDCPELLAPDDPEWPKHYLEVARLPAPPFPRPGAAGSGRFGVFEKVVWTGHLSFDKGLYIELELVESRTTQDLLADAATEGVTTSGSTSVFVDSWGGAVQCYGICLDINWDNFVDEADFLMVIGGCGRSTVGETACMDGALSRDGYVDSYDVASWDWALNSSQRLLNYCGVPLTGSSTALMGGGATRAGGSGLAFRLAALPDDLGELLIVGKSGEADIRSKLKDSLYVFGDDGSCRGTFEPVSQRCNVRLLPGPDGAIYLLNTETGLCRLDDTDEVVVPPGKIRLTGITEPRYNTPATVYVGIQDKGSNSFGRPLLDAAVDAAYVYVVPVVVAPQSGDPYMAAAKLRLLQGGSPPYELVGLYDDPPLPNDNQYRDYLRELELDSAGNLYVLNVHSLNESDILWRFAPDGAVERVDLGFAEGDSYVPAPVGMVASKSAEMLYLTSSTYDPVDPDSTVIYGFSTSGALTLERVIAVNGMQHITSITENPQTGTLWAAGFNMYKIPAYPNPTRSAFYYPCLAKISSDDDVKVTDLFDPDMHDLALPMSILWTGAVE